MFLPLTYEIKILSTKENWLVFFFFYKKKKKNCVALNDRKGAMPNIKTIVLSTT